jgi:hypothetical protein
MIIGESVSIEPMQFPVRKPFRFGQELEPTLGKWPFYKAKSAVKARLTRQFSEVKLTDTASSIFRILKFLESCSAKGRSARDWPSRRPVMLV